LGTAAFGAIYGFLITVIVVGSVAVTVGVVTSRNRENTEPMAPFFLGTGAARGVAIFGLWIAARIEATVTGNYTPIGLWVTLGYVAFMVLILFPIGLWVVGVRKRNGWVPGAR
jgi:hypothetical protein